MYTLCSYECVDSAPYKHTDNIMWWNNSIWRQQAAPHHNEMVFWYWHVKSTCIALRSFYLLCQPFAIGFVYVRKTIQKFLFGTIWVTSTKTLEMSSNFNHTNKFSHDFGALDHSSTPISCWPTVFFNETMFCLLLSVEYSLSRRHMCAYECVWMRCNKLNFDSSVYWQWTNTPMPQNSFFLFLGVMHSSRNALSTHIHYGKSQMA